MEPGADGKDMEIGPDRDRGRAVGKGKDVARGENDHEPATLPGAESIMSRLGRSATGLSQSMLHSKPIAGDLVDVSSSGKVGPSSSDKPTAPGEGSSTTRPRADASSTGLFRSAQGNVHVAAEEAAFSDFLDGLPAFVATETVGMERAWQAASVAAEATPGTNEAPIFTSACSVAEQQARDGVEVVRLLSQATEEEAPDFGEAPAMSEEDIKSLSQALFKDRTSGQASATDWNNVLNFIPDFLGGETDGTEPEASGNRHMHLGVTCPAEAGQIWLEQWNRVLTGYTDEVWGDLGQLVKEARREVVQMRDRSDDQAMRAPAVRQLRSILERVRARL